nr:immunoglobulin light chain junction region [Macaca mulatta]
DYYCYSGNDMDGLF